MLIAILDIMGAVSTPLRLLAGRFFHASNIASFRIIQAWACCLPTHGISKLIVSGWTSIIGNVPRYSNAFLMPVVLSCINHTASFFASSTYHKPVPSVSQAKFVPLSTVLKVLFHVFFRVLLAFVRRLELSSHFLLLVPELVGDDEGRVLLSCHNTSLEIAVFVVSEEAALLDDVSQRIFHTCCPAPEAKDHTHHESPRALRSGKKIFTSGRCHMLETISSN